MRPIAAVHNPNTRQPIIQQSASGKNPANTASALNVQAVRNPQARVYAAPNIKSVKKANILNPGKTT